MSTQKNIGNQDQRLLKRQIQKQQELISALQERLERRLSILDENEIVDNCIESLSTAIEKTVSAYTALVALERAINITAEFPESF